MSKIKISELAKELGVEGKEVVSFLQEKGVESAKRSTSSVEDEDAEKARKHFSKKSSARLLRKTQLQKRKSQQRLKRNQRQK